MRTPFTVASSIALVSLVAAQACVPPRTLIVRVPAAPTTGTTYACTTLDLSATDPDNPPVQDTCPNHPVGNAEPGVGVPENAPNTRYVYAAVCGTMYELRVLDPSSDHPRVTVTCATPGGQ